MRILKFVRLILAMFLFGVVCTLVYEISVRSALHQVQKYDDANINHMKYGLFNVNAWKEKMANIVVSEIEEFKIEKAHKKDLRKHVEGQLNVLIDKLDNQIKESNQGTTKGWIKQKLIETFVDIKDIKEKIPDYADTIVEEMTHKESQKKLKQVIKGRVSKYLDETFEPQDMAEVESIIKRTGQANHEDAVTYLLRVVPEGNAFLFELTWLLIAAAVSLFLVALFHKGRFPALYFLLCMVTLILLLYVGVTRPMIDMVARISNFSFVLFGHPVQFTNQIVYFQSKSILDVFWILMEHQDPEMKVVGVLMVMFSIVFPVIKLVASMFYYYNIFRARERGWISYMVFKLGKWSMTDVQIVAIMMAYIGFNGMVKTQFDIIRETIPQFNLISTNDTTLQIGFYIFLCYVILAMFFAMVLEKKMQAPQN